MSESDKTHNIAFNATQNTRALIQRYALEEDIVKPWRDISC